jgi:hypothetical protein
MLLKTVLLILRYAVNLMKIVELLLRTKNMKSRNPIHEFASIRLGKYSVH